MAHLVKECSICDYEYDRQNKKPLVLPCGHSFCSGCLALLKSNKDNSLCPMCRSDITNVDLDQINPCWQLISDAEGGAAGGGVQTNDACDEHGFRLAFWCQTCEKRGCKTCLDGTHKTCDWILIEPAVQESIDQLPNLLPAITNRAEETKLKIDTAIAANNAKVNTTRMFKMKVKESENDIVDFKDNLQTLKIDLTDSCIALNGLTVANFRAGGMEQMLKTKKLTEQQVPVGPMSTILNIAEAYQAVEENVSVETFLSSFCKVHQGLEDGTDWHVTTSTAATTSLVTLTTADIRPSKLILAVNQNWSERRRLKALLPVVARECPAVHLRFLKSFWNPSDDSVETDRNRLECFISSSDRCQLEQIICHLNAADVRTIPTAGLTKLGLAVADAAGVEAANAVQGIRAAVGSVLRELHLSVSTSVTEDTVGRLCPELYDGFPLHFHFPGLTDDRLLWLMLVLRKMMAEHANSASIQKIYLPNSGLTMRGAELLLGVLHGSDLTKNLFLSSSHISEQQTLKLTEMFQNCNINVTWDQDKLWDD